MKIKGDIECMFKPVFGIILSNAWFSLHCKNKLIKLLTMVLVSTSTDYREQSKMLQCSQSSTWALFGNFVRFCFMATDKAVRTSPFCRM